MISENKPDNRHAVDVKLRAPKRNSNNLFIQLRLLKYYYSKILGCMQDFNLQIN